MHSRIRPFVVGGVLLVGFGAVAQFSGCASASTAAGMTTAVATPAAAKHSQSVVVQVTGGSESNSMGASQISSADFASAIQTSIAQSGLFAKLAPAADADYEIDVHIVRLTQPTFGLSFTVTMEADWSLVLRSQKKTVWEKAITSTFTATVSDAFAGVKRLRLANEGAAKKNIEDAITQISALTLP